MSSGYIRDEELLTLLNHTEVPETPPRDEADGYEGTEEKKKTVGLGELGVGVMAANGGGDAGGGPEHRFRKDMKARVKALSASLKESLYTCMTDVVFEYGGLSWSVSDGGIPLDVVTIVRNRMKMAVVLMGDHVEGIVECLVREIGAVYRKNNALEDRVTVLEMQLREAVDIQVHLKNRVNGAQHGAGGAGGAHRSCLGTRKRMEDKSEDVERGTLLKKKR